MNEQLTSDELRQVLAEWIRPMYPKQRQKIAGLFEAVIARAEAAEAEAEDAILVASDAAQREENAMHALSHFRARVAELEAQLAAQQWRPVTEEWPPYDKCVPVRMRNGAIRWGFRRGDFWHLTVGKYGREGVTHAYVLPPAPQETE